MTSLAVIIPVLNEAEGLPRTLEQLKLRDGDTLIVVDGGSSDSSMEIAQDASATVLHSVKGRGLQLAKGLEEVQSEYLVLLHADTALPSQWRVEVETILADPKVSCGAFRLSFFNSFAGGSLVAAFANFRSRFLQCPYGDQALFMRRTDLERIGGIPEIPILEDLELVKRLKKLGRISISKEAVATNGRRWKGRAGLKTTLVNWTTAIGYRMGVSPWALSQWRERVTS